MIDWRKFSRPLVHVLQLLVITYLLVVLAVLIFQRCLIYFPTKIPADAIESVAAEHGFAPWKNPAGQVAAAKLSQKILGLPSGDVGRIEKLFASAGLPVKIKLPAAPRKKLFAAMKLDKKVSGGEIKFVLAEKISKVAWGQKVSSVLIEEVLAGAGS